MNKVFGMFAQKNFRAVLRKLPPLPHVKNGAKVLGKLCDSPTLYISSVTISVSANNYLS